MAGHQGLNIKKSDTAKDIKVDYHSYPEFDQLNGWHPYQEEVPGGSIHYQVRKKNGGKVVFFNFSLASEIGLIDGDHAYKMNKKLENKILDTFALVIINEYDIIHGHKFPQKEIKQNQYMATKYLQLQHPDKKGKQSGDGRSIWNGTIKKGSITWDVSSCGTGATKLSPASSIHKKFYKTGDPSISYGCGLSDVSEGIETLFFSETLAKNGFSTERILAIIEFDKGQAINVRAHPNLIRPSHFFSPLKQGDFFQLKKIADYYIRREISNGNWRQKSFKTEKEKYYFLAQMVAEKFSEVAARFEDEYIFCWLDWDGDNILMDGGIIDYGSLRQFGLFHSDYRFDDHDRFSTTIKEQKNKARYITQCFIQIADFLTYKKKSPLTKFKNHPLLTFFDENFQKHKDINLLLKMGFNKSAVNNLLKSPHSSLVRSFRKVFFSFETTKSKKRKYKVADGITRDAIFCMRDILRELPQIILVRNKVIPHHEFLEILKSTYARKGDLKLTPERKLNISLFQQYYLELVDEVANEEGCERNEILLEMMMRSSVINKYERITGDSISYITQKLFKIRKKLSAEDFYDLLQDFTYYQNLDPDKRCPRRFLKKNDSLMKSFSLIIKDCRDGL